MSASRPQHSNCPGVVAAGPHALTDMEFYRAIRRLGMSTQDVADMFDIFPVVVRWWESGVETVPAAVVDAIWGWIAEQDQEIDRQIARLSGVREPQLVIRRGGMKGHPLDWWKYVACQVPVGVDDVRIVYVD